MRRIIFASLLLITVFGFAPSANADIQYYKLVGTVTSLYEDTGAPLDYAVGDPLTMYIGVDTDIFSNYAYNLKITATGMVPEYPSNTPYTTHYYAEYVGGNLQSPYYTPSAVGDYTEFHTARNNTSTTDEIVLGATGNSIVLDSFTFMFDPGETFRLKHDLYGESRSDLSYYRSTDMHLAADFTQGTLLKPQSTPLPGAIWLLASGLIGLAGLRKNRL